MDLVEIRRYPVKSMGGELLASADLDERGLVGDRVWAVHLPDDKLGSGKNSVKGRRVAGLLELTARTRGRTPWVDFGDGRELAVGDPALEPALTARLGRPIRLGLEAGLRHHDDGPVSLLTTAAMRWLGDLVGDEVAALRFRANLLVDTPGTGNPEDDWIGRTVCVGDDVRLVVRERLVRCVMIDMAQEEVAHDGRLLKAVGAHHELTFGVWATVERPGRVRVGDRVRVDGPAA